MPKDYESDFDVKLVEAALQSLPTEAVSLNRDELMYNAGWAAALASLEYQPANGAVAQLDSGPSGSQKSFAWPAISLLASIAALVFAILFFNRAPLDGNLVRSNVTVEVGATPDTAGPTASNPVANSESNPAVNSQIKNGRVQTKQRDLISLVFGLPANERDLPAILLRSRMMSGEIQSPSNEVRNFVAQKETWRATATSDQLMREMLPGSFKRRMQGSILFFEPRINVN